MSWGRQRHEEERLLFILQNRLTEARFILDRHLVEFFARWGLMLGVAGTAGVALPNLINHL